MAKKTSTDETKKEIIGYLPAIKDSPTSMNIIQVIKIALSPACIY